MKNEHLALGLMSGTSLDGLDLALCSFSQIREAWYYKILQAETIEYPEEWKKRIQNAMELNGSDLMKLDADLGNYFGELSRDFLKKNTVQPSVIASHGHTIFHQPANGFTVQIGRGANIAAKTKLPVVCDFRTGDVAYGGQGAPLVPFGDKKLFAAFPLCLNIGGIANISVNDKGPSIAFDICPANIILNFLAAKLNQSYDKDGLIAKSGTVDHSLLAQLNKLDYYSDPFPKSLGREWIDQIFLPVIKKSESSINDIMATCCEHIAQQIGGFLKERKGQMLVTGGGAWNKFLVECITSHTDVLLVIPDELTVNYKEAMIFAFLGLMRSRNEINTESTVTGATKSLSAGCIYLP